MTDDVSPRSPRRRELLGLAIFGIALVGATASRAETAACEADDDSARSSMRLTLEYVSPSATPGKTCAGCSFFTASAPPCGACKLIGGPVTAGAVCGSWAPKKK